MTNVRLIEVFEGEDGQYYWRGKSANGEIVTHGEGHTRMHDAKRAAMDVLPGILVKEVQLDDGGDEDV